MILSRFVKPRASRTALITASVPELTSRTFSTDGTAATIFSRQPHFGFRARAERRAPRGGVRDGLDDARRRMAEDQRPPGHHMVDVAVAVHVEDVRPFAALHEQRVAADALEGAHGRIDAAGDDALRLGEQPRGGV